METIGYEEEKIKVVITTAQALLIFVVVLIYCLGILGVGTLNAIFEQAI